MASPPAIVASVFAAHALIRFVHTPRRSVTASRRSPGAEVYTDENKSYERRARYRHEAVAHGVGEFVKGKVHTNSVENAWSLLKQAYHGTYHRMSPKHLHRYITALRAGATTGSLIPLSR